MKRERGLWSWVLGFWVFGFLVLNQKATKTYVPRPKTQIPRPKTPALLLYQLNNSDRMIPSHEWNVLVCAHIAQQRK